MGVAEETYNGPHPLRKNMCSAAVGWNILEKIRRVVLSRPGGSAVRQKEKVSSSVTESRLYCSPHDRLIN